MTRRKPGRVGKILIAAGVTVALAVGAVITGAYVSQRQSLDAIAAEYSATVAGASKDSSEYSAALLTRRGVALSALPLFATPEWSAYVDAVTRADAADLTELKKEFTRWGDRTLWFPDLIGEHHRFIDHLALSIGPLDRAKLTTVYTVSVLCSAPDDGVDAAVKDLAPMFKLDSSGTLLPQLAAARTQLCAISD